MQYHIIIGVMLTLAIALTDGGRLRRNIFGGTVPPGATCLFNPCVQPINYCKNDGNCSLNETTCHYKCTCQDGFEGARCEVNLLSTTKEISNPTSNPVSGSSVTSVTSGTTTLRPLSERTCFTGFVCEHGYCDKKAFKCICDFGWQGPFCRTQGTCPLTCGDGKVCVIVQNSYFCAIATTVTNQPANASSDMTQTITTSSKITSTTTTEDSSTVSTTPLIDGHSENYEHVCSSNYTLRPQSERTCLSIFVCKYGRCVKKSGPNGLVFYCICDKGATGPFCKNMCCLNCSENGVCMKHTNGTEFCNCKSMYRGKFCEIPVQSGATTNTPTQQPSTIPSSTTPSSDSSNRNASSQQFEQQMFPDGHACSSNYTVKPMSERACVPNFVCTYGSCDMEHRNDSLVFKCTCDDGASGGVCQDKCCLLCSENGKCKKFGNGTEYCNCKYGYTGYLCETKVAIPSFTSELSDNDWVYWVVGICLVVLVILLLLAVVLPYYMWKNRVTLIMKIVHYFQPYEDDDERTWDAFVSYKSSQVDEEFVLNTLYPKLEKELGFTLCLHFRDFVPGEAISNNIINAVNNSRRTILILTPRYVESEFTRFEYQVAQTEMLKRKHRIIPILLEDISDVSSAMDPNLKQIIKSVTYLEYPGTENEKKLNGFWKRLELSLPKKRLADNEIKSSQSSYSTSKTESDNISVSVISSTDFKKSEKGKESTKMTSFSNGTVINPEDVSVQINGDKKNNILNGDLEHNINKYMTMMENSSC